MLGITYICFVLCGIIIFETLLLLRYRRNIEDFVKHHNESITRIILNEDLLDSSIKQISEVYGIDEEELLDILAQHREKV